MSTSPLPSSSIYETCSTLSQPINASDPTLQHLLNLPIALQNVSPALAALHLARIRLSLLIPTSNKFNGKNLEEWCNSCGGLRLSLGGSREREKEREKGENNNNIIEKELNNKMEFNKARTPIKKIKQRRNPICSLCGINYKKPIPNKEILKDYPPARITRRMKLNQNQNQNQNQKQNQQIEKNGNKSNQMIEVELGQSLQNSIGLQLDLGNSFQQDLKSNIEVTLNTNTEMVINENSISQTYQNEFKQKPLSLVQRPSLTHIPKSSPNLPSYPQPPARTTSSNIISNNIDVQGKKSNLNSSSGNLKKKKKSGLAKLLAENKEREINKGNGGMWALG
ncbi:uncharacterized protein I206_106015 [Kwoniella pini CBS 10737]|uniref:Uncharacterized protein n=1 Tax=Kwoniella pini CBS 10737 TaxID=1296096 RepID=A0A1B9I0T7_9TREE|nr:uncharacterized protein I206_04838 [Kwoniella pini CBS 10737]OCF49150.1 hypothetical protein I206_04838 [Kwoniella pini CBS 10737]